MHPARARGTLAWVTEPLRELVNAAFGKRREAAPSRASVDATAAIVGVGLDHEAGERAWIARPHEVQSHSVVGALLVTDRRIAGVKRMPGDIHLTGSDSGFAVPGWKGFSLTHDSVESLEVMLPLVGTEHRVRLRDGRVVRIPRCGAWSSLRAFIKGLLKLPIEQRRALDAPLERERPSSDPWAAVVAHVEALRERGELDAATAQDLIARVRLHSRARRHGQGGDAQRWTTALSSHDLADVLMSVLGPPIRASRDPRVLELALATPNDAAALALGNALGMASLMLTGVGGMIVPGVTSRWVRVEVESTPTACRYALFCEDRDVPLHVRRPEVVAALHRVIRRAEADLLVRRCALGASIRATELWAVSPSDVLAGYRRTAPALRLEDLPGPPE